jgi:hypothetical protein
MGIKNVQTSQVGLVGVVPQFIYIATDNTLAQVTVAGYLNNIINLGYSLSEDMMAVVSTIETAGGPISVGVYNVTFSAGNWSLTASSVPAGSITNAQIAANAAIAFSKLAALPSGQIIVGSAGSVPTAVAMSGDATIVAAGALTIAANAITTAKILNANVTLAKLAAGITPSHVIKFAGQLTTVGGAAAEAFTVTGASSATDTAFVQVVNDGTANVTVLEAVVTNNTLTVTFSGNPGGDCIFNYQIIRAAS